MSFLFIIVGIFQIIICILLILVILMQSAKGHGLTGAFGSFGGGFAQNIFGAQAGDVLTNITTGLAILFAISSITLAVLSTKSSSTIMKAEKKKKVVKIHKKIDKATDVKKAKNKPLDKKDKVERTVKKQQNTTKKEISPDNVKKSVEEKAGQIKKDASTETALPQSK